MPIYENDQKNLKSADPRSGVLEYLEMRGEVCLPLPPSALGVGTVRPQNLRKGGLMDTHPSEGLVEGKNTPQRNILWLAMGGNIYMLT